MAAFTTAAGNRAFINTAIAAAKNGTLPGVWVNHGHAGGTLTHGPRAVRMLVNGVSFWFHVHHVCEGMPYHDGVIARTEAIKAEQDRATPRGRRKKVIALRRRRRLARAQGAGLPPGSLGVFRARLQAERLQRPCPGVCPYSVCRHGRCPERGCPVCDDQRRAQSGHPLP